MPTTRAAGRRWLDANVGRTLLTCQVYGNGRTWTPGPRVLSRRHASAWTLTTPEGRGSDITLGNDTVVLRADDEHLVLQWIDGEGVVIHVTTYTVQHTL